MITGILFLWILSTMNAPTWTMVLAWIMVILKFIEYSLNLWKKGKEE